MQAQQGASETAAQAYVSLLNRGIAHHHAGRQRRRALSAYREALTCNPHSDIAFACLGDVLNCLGRHEEALVASRCATDLIWACALAYFSEVEALMNLRLYEETPASCEQAIALTRSADAYTVKADILTELQRYEEALHTYSHALLLNPRHAAIYNNLGLLLICMQRYEEAQRSFEQAIQLEPDEALFYANLPCCLQELGKADEAAQAQANAQTLYLQHAQTTLLEVAQDQTPWEDMETAYMPSPKLFRSLKDWL